MLTCYNSLIHGDFWLNSNPLPYLLPIPAVLHPPSASMMSAGQRAARKRSRKLCRNECTRQPSGRGPRSCGLTVERIGSSCTGQRCRGTGLTIHGIDLRTKLPPNEFTTPILKGRGPRGGPYDRGGPGPRSCGSIAAIRHSNPCYKSIGLDNPNPN